MNVYDNQFTDYVKSVFQSRCVVLLFMCFLVQFLWIVDSLIVSKNGYSFKAVSFCGV